MSAFAEGKEAAAEAIPDKVASQVEEAGKLTEGMLCLLVSQWTQLSNTVANKTDHALLGSMGHCGSVNAIPMAPSANCMSCSSNLTTLSTGVCPVLQLCYAWLKPMQS